MSRSPGDAKLAWLSRQINRNLRRVGNAHRARSSLAAAAHPEFPAGRVLRGFRLREDDLCGGR